MLQASAAVLVLWGTLQPGTHAVGFRTEMLSDPARHYGAAGTQRPVLAAMWYPAVVATGKSMVFGDYLQVAAEDRAHPDFAARLSRFTRATVIEDLFQRPAVNLTDIEQTMFRRLTATAVAARREAEAASGRFPVILYHHGNGGTYEENSVLFEYLASHGYIVLSSAFPCPEPTTFGNCPGNPAMRDLDFLLRWAMRLPQADKARVAMMGHSAGGQAGLRYAFLPDTPLQAVVSFDSTIEQWGLDHARFSSLRGQLDENEQYTVPTLLFAPQRGLLAPKFQELEARMRYAPRSFVTVTGLAHDEYLSDGVLVDALGEQRDRFGIWQGVARYTHAFLNRHVRGEAQDLRTPSSPAMRVDVREAKPAPPTPLAIISLLERVGPQQARQSLEKFGPDLDVDAVMQAARHLMEAGRHEDAGRISNWLQRWLPKNAMVHVLAGELWNVRGDRKKAAAALDKAVRLAEADKDFTEEDRANVRQLADNVRRGW